MMYSGKELPLSDYYTNSLVRMPFYYDLEKSSLEIIY